MSRYLGDYVHDLRLKRNISLRKASADMGFSAMYLSEIESGKKIPSGEILHKLADFYRVDFFDLVLKCDKSLPNSENYRMAVARMVDGLSDEKVRKVLDFIQTIEGE